MRRPVPLVGVLAILATGVVGAPSEAGAAPGSVPVQVLAINDLHGRISLTAGNESRLVTGPGRDGVFGRNEAGETDDPTTRVGGAMNIATTVQELQTAFRRQAGGSAASFLVGAGDLIGASPSLSGDFKDEPIIEVLNALGLDVSAAGDDEFQHGTGKLRRLSGATDGQFGDDVTACQGVTAGVDGCFGTDEHAFSGARFPYLAANVVSRGTREPVLPPYQVLFTPSGKRIALIGVVTENPRHVPPAAIADVQFLDPADSVDRWVPEIRDEGIEAIGVLVHEGGSPAGPAALDPNGCDQLEGPIVDINNRIDPAVDLVVSGHSHAAYSCLLPAPGGPPRLVTQAGAYGRLVTDIRLTLDPGTGDVDRAATYSAVNVPVTRGNPDDRLQAIVDYWTEGPGSRPADEAPGDVLRAVGTPAPSTGTRTLGAVAILTSVGLLLGAWLRFGRSTGRKVPNDESRWSMRR